MTKNIRHIVFLAIQDVTLLDIAGPCEVFTQAMEYLHGNKGTYKLHLLSIDDNLAVQTASGFAIQCEGSIMDLDFPIDTLLIPGVPNWQIEKYKLPENVLRWIYDQSKVLRRICSVCTGSFFLAQAGVLSGHTATTHWEKCATLKQAFPDIEVENDPIFIKDNNIYTSAGISSGMDLALTLIEEDHGRAFSLEIAKQMVLYLKRQGSQSQYSTILTHQNTDYQPIQTICEWISKHLNEAITVEYLADKASMSPRNFARVFAREMKITPAKYIDKVRIETACRYLTDTRLSQKVIADLCGFGSSDNMRKVFQKHIHTSPIEYRRNFG